jgi:hypothetical protein
VGIGPDRNKNATVKPSVGEEEGREVLRSEFDDRRAAGSDLVDADAESADGLVGWDAARPVQGRATYTLTPQGGGTTKFNMREEYSGPLTSMIWRSIPDLGPSFTQFANGLKQKAESS